MNKIEQEQLARLTELNRSFRDLKFQVADIELSFERLKTQKVSTMANLEFVVHDMAKYQEELTAKYGDITVNLQTGEYH
jgi:cell division protein ZapA (FtsZ GTPase activity inhibitor)